jgi:hypothetical protein
MKLENVTAVIRPRSDWEAVDLGFAMVRRDFWRCLTAWCLAVAAPTALAIWLLWDHPVWLLLLFWWWRPAGSRMVLFELSRRLFGEAPAWRDVWREIPRAWTRRFFHRFLLLRLSPWLPVTLAIESLENLRGREYSQRAARISRRGESAVIWIYLMGDLLAAWLGIGFFYLFLMFIPQGGDGAWQAAVESFDWSRPDEIPLIILRSAVLWVMAAMVFCDIFQTGAGFGVYINNRTWLEGWDVELAFRRLNRRLTTTGLIAAAATALVFSSTSQHAIANDTRADAMERIQQVKDAPEFEVHSVTDRVPVPRDWSWLDWLDFSGDASWFQTILSVAGYTLLAAFIAFLGWLVWRYRHLFAARGHGGAGRSHIPQARVVMGLEVSHESLPDNIPGEAWRLWAGGHHHDALALLYRGAISSIVRHHHVPIEESDTEGDCLRRVNQANCASSAYFDKLTRQWMASAYAGHPPDESHIRALCENWPFSTERRAG